MRTRSANQNLVETTFQCRDVWQSQTDLVSIVRTGPLFSHGLQEFIVKNIEGESTEANDLSHTLQKRVCCVNNSKCCKRFHLTLQEAFETDEQINKELKITGR